MWTYKKLKLLKLKFLFFLYPRSKVEIYLVLKLVGSAFESNFLFRLLLFIKKSLVLLTKINEKLSLLKKLEIE